MTRLNDKFNFFVPAKFEKSGENGEMKISGICSSSVEDSDGETLEPSGFDFQPLLEKGYYNWNHQASKDPGAILGRPVKASIINQGKDFYTEGFLYKGLPQAKDLYQLAKTLEKEDPERRLGFSIEGQAIQRDPINPKRITKARITGIAITHCPKNPNTLLNIIKGEYQDSFIEEQVEVNETEKGGRKKFQKKYIGKNGKWVYIYDNKEQSKNWEKYEDYHKQIQSLISERKQLVQDMENDPDIEIEGGEVADSYGSKLNEFDKQIESIRTKALKLDLSPSKHVESDEWVPAPLLQLQTVNKSISTTNLPMPDKGEYQDSFIEEQVEDNNTEKGGEGSRGGKVIGHTKSGKPIYAIKNARHEAKYTSQDHNDAAYAHLDHALKLHKEGKEDQADRHNSMFDEHMGTYRHKRRQEEIDKSISTENVPMPESIDGVKKTLSKSEIYLSIFNTYTNEVEKAERIYNFTQQVSQKIFNMTEITPEVLEKAFQLLDSSIEKSKKSDLNGEEKKPEDYDKKDELLKNDEEETTTTTTLKEDDNEDEVEKACSMLAKEKLEKGSSRGQAIDDLVEKGYSLEMSQGCVDRCIQEMNAKKDGGDITPASTLKKSEVDVLQKSLEQIGLNIDEKFSALGQILKSQVEQNDLLKSEVANLQKSNTDLTTQLQKLSSTPFPTKSVRDVRAVERFEKSSDGKQVLSLSDSVQRKTLVDSLFGQVQIMKSQNRDYSQIEKAIMDIEISKSVDQQSQSLINQLGYTVVQ